MSDNELVPIQEAPITVKTLSSLLGSPTVPARYEAVADMVATVLVGRELGLAPMSALNNLFVVNGQVGMNGKAMLALVHRAGHRIDTKISTDGAESTAWRRDPLTDELIEVGTFTFTMEDAKRAKLADQGTYKQFPQIMLGWRAVSLAVRFAFSDVITGVLLPEEIGIEAEVEELPDAVLVTDLDDDSEVVEADDVTLELSASEEEE